jgi:hypothetical protein
MSPAEALLAASASEAISQTVEASAALQTGGHGFINGNAAAE